ncbi:MAG: prephenate dehydratase [Gilvibacter sp.]
MMQTIAIQGVKGSNHHKAAQLCYGDALNVLECDTFDDVVSAVLNQSADAGIMAVENSIAGAILPNYALIDTNDLWIGREHYLRVSHNLMGLPNQDLSTLTEVHSHYMALLQCSQFFKDYSHIKLVEDIDTAITAKRIQEENIHGIAAIATKTAADLYGLQIYAEDIQTIKKNATRFAVVHKNKPKENSQINKASIKFALEHKRGSLATALNVMSDCNLSLTKIQSLPIVDKPFKYAFFVDVLFESPADYEKAKALLKIMATHFKVLGEYQNSKDD